MVPIETGPSRAHPDIATSASHGPAARPLACRRLRLEAVLETSTPFSTAKKKAFAETEIRTPYSHFPPPALPPRPLFREGWGRRGEGERGAYMTGQWE